MPRLPAPEDRTLRQTLFYIPDAAAGLPLFGWGLLVWVWLVLAVGGWAWRRHRLGPHPDDSANLTMIAAVGAVLVWVMPMMKVVEPAGSGIPIRGFGIMVLLGMISGLWLAARRAQRAGLNPDTVFNLATWLIVAGVIGARGFYVVEYWKEFVRPDPLQVLQAVLAVAGGGIVLYGGLLGGAVGFLLFCRRHALPPLAMGDVIAPALVLGYAFGRIGCLMNGCCFGGLCEQPWAFTFPPHSPPYMRQVQEGKLPPPTAGLVLDETPLGFPRVVAVFPESPAAKAGFGRGDLVTAIGGVPVRSLDQSDQLFKQFEGRLTPFEIQGRGKIDLQLGAPRSLPIHPTQAYSSINAFLLVWLLVAVSSLRPRDGTVIGLLLTLYPISRFLIEEIRTDEPGILGTRFSIAQIVGAILVVAMLGYWKWLYSRPAEPAPWPAEARLPTA